MVNGIERLKTEADIGRYDSPTCLGSGIDNESGQAIIIKYSPIMLAVE